MGAVLTKMDGDARGWRRPERARGDRASGQAGGCWARRWRTWRSSTPTAWPAGSLGMGDVLTLIEQAEEKMDLDQAEHLAGRFAEGEFTLEDFLGQIQQMKKMGPLKGILKMLPGMNSGMLDKANVDDKQFVKVEAMIQSMTRAERRKPDLINGSRRKRIARGSGTTVSQVNKLLKQYRDMRRMMRDINAAGGLQEFGKNFMGGQPGQ